MRDGAKGIGSGTNMTICKQRRRPRVRAAQGRAPLAVLLLGLVLAACSGNAPAVPTGDFSLDAKIERGTDGRVVVTGHAGAPDGSWVYVETVAAPDDLAGVWAEAFPVAANRFALATPFTALLSYRATVVLSPNLNPMLASRMAALPSREGVVMRPAGSSKEIVAEARASFGTARERGDAARAIADSLLTVLESLRGDLEVLSGKSPKDLSSWHKDFANHRQAAQDDMNLAYSPETARAIDKACADMEEIFRLLLSGLEGKEVPAGKIEKPASRAERLLADAKKRLEEIRTKD